MERVIETLKAKRHEIDELIALAEGLQGRVDALLGAPMVPAPVSHNGKHPTLTIAQTAAEIIKELGRPMRPSAILKAFQARGVEVGGKNPLVTLYSAMKRSSLLQRRTGGEWTLRK